MWWTVVTVAGWVILVVLAGLVLTRFLAQFSFEHNLVTGERSLSRSSRLGRYYDWLAFSDNRFFKQEWWNNGNSLDVCTVGSRVFWRTVFLAICAVTALMLLTGFFVLPYGVYKYGWVVLSDISKVPISLLMKSIFFVGGLAWLLVGTFILIVSMRFLGEKLNDWVAERDSRKQVVSEVEPTIKQEPVLTAWLKSVKDRVCYRVKVVD